MYWLHWLTVQRVDGPRLHAMALASADCRVLRSGERRGGMACNRELFRSPYARRISGNISALVAFPPVLALRKSWTLCTTYRLPLTKSGGLPARPSAAGKALTRALLQAVLSLRADLKCRRCPSVS